MQLLFFNSSPHLWPLDGPHGSLSSTPEGSEARAPEFLVRPRCFGNAPGAAGALGAGDARRTGAPVRTGWRRRPALRSAVRNGPPVRGRPSRRGAARCRDCRAFRHCANKSFVVAPRFVRTVKERFFDKQRPCRRPTCWAESAAVGPRRRAASAASRPTTGDAASVGDRRRPPRRRPHLLRRRSATGNRGNPTQTRRN